MWKMLPKLTYHLIILLEITMEWWLPTVLAHKPCVLTHKSELAANRCARRQHGGPGNAASYNNGKGVIKPVENSGEDAAKVAKAIKEASSKQPEVFTDAEGHKFTFEGPSTKGVRTKKARFLSTKLAVSFDENCDYLAYYCMRAYDTGKVCGRTLYFNYDTFENYCMLDYVNCMERYEVWQVAYMGECFNVTELSQFEDYPNLDDKFLDQMYVLDM